MTSRGKDEREYLCQLLQQAREEWQLANNYLNWVTEPALIDYAIYWSRAAQSRYTHLLGNIKRASYTLQWTEVFQQVLKNC